MSQSAVGGKKLPEQSAIARRCLIALGSNQNFDDIGPADLLFGAFQALEARGFVIRKRSRFFQTPAFPAGAGPDFVNAAAELETKLDAYGVLEQLHAVEADLGRERVARWGARTLDLDLIAMGSLVLPDAKTYHYWCQLPLEAQKATAPTQLILPHPRLAERAFVLVPLNDVAPGWCHPVTGDSVQQMYEALSEEQKNEVVAL